MEITKSKAMLVTAVVMLIVLFPVKENWAEKPKDNFPLSYYPMFAKKRDNHYGMYYVTAMDTLGQKMKISYKLIGTGGFNQVRRQISQARKTESGRPFLKKVAMKVERKSPDLHGRLTSISLVKGYYNLEGFFVEQDTLPVLERTIATYKLN